MAGQKRSYRIIASSVFGLGLVWVVVAALSGYPEHGELGGALGVILALWVIAKKPTFGFVLLDQIRKNENAARETEPVTGPTPTELSNTELTTRALAIEAVIRTGSDIERENIRWLAIATIIGTVFWGFGELLAKFAVSLFG